MDLGIHIEKYMCYVIQGRTMLDYLQIERSSNQQNSYRFLEKRNIYYVETNTNKFSNIFFEKY